MKVEEYALAEDYCLMLAKDGRSNGVTAINSLRALNRGDIVLSEAARLVGLEISPAEWFKTYVAPGHPQLAAVADRILCIPASAAGGERNWSCFDAVLDPMRSRLALERVNMLVFVSFNQRVFDRPSIYSSSSSAEAEGFPEFMVNFMQAAEEDAAVIQLNMLDDAAVITIPDDSEPLGVQLPIGGPIQQQTLQQCLPAVSPQQGRTVVSHVQQQAAVGAAPQTSPSPAINLNSQHTPNQQQPIPSGWMSASDYYGQNPEKRPRTTFQSMGAEFAALMGTQLQQQDSVRQPMPSTFSLLSQPSPGEQSFAQPPNLPSPANNYHTPGQQRPWPLPPNGWASWDSYWAQNPNARPPAGFRYEGQYFISRGFGTQEALDDYEEQLLEEEMEREMRTATRTTPRRTAMHCSLHT